MSAAEDAVRFLDEYTDQAVEMLTNGHATADMVVSALEQSARRLGALMLETDEPGPTLAIKAIKRNAFARGIILDIEQGART